MTARARPGAPILLRCSRSRVRDLRRRAVTRPPAPWRWLDPNLPLGTTTVADAMAAAAAGDSRTTIRRWADDVWAGYAAHHAEVRTWVDHLLA